MSEADRIQEALRLVGAETAAAEASPRVRAAVLRQVRRRRLRSVAPWWLAAAAALVIGVSMGVWSRLGEKASPQPQVATRNELAPEVSPMPGATPDSLPAIPPAPVAAVRRAVRTPAVPAARLAATPWMVHQALPPARTGQVLRLPVSAELARQFGVPPRSGEWQAEIFVGDDGLARAFRLVRIPAYR